MNKHEYEPGDHAQTWCSDCKEPRHPDELKDGLCEMCAEVEDDFEDFKKDMTL